MSIMFGGDGVGGVEYKTITIWSSQHCPLNACLWLTNVHIERFSRNLI